MGGVMRCFPSPKSGVVSLVTSVDASPIFGFSGGLQVLAEREGLIAINKPANLLTHRSKIFPEATDAQALLEAAVGERVFTVHRLDRKTSGVLLFARSAQTAGEVGTWFREGQVHKVYWAVVRGFVPDEVVVDRPLRHPDNRTMQEAVSRVRCVARVELPHAVGPYVTARYSLVEVRPETGRRHQLRRHLRGINHPIVGDTVYGDGRHNAFFRAQFGWHRMFLHACQLTLPSEKGASGCWSVAAPLEAEFTAACVAFSWPQAASSPQE